MWKRWVVAGCILALGLIAAGLTQSWLNSHPPIHIFTDSVPLKIQFNDTSFTLNSNKKTIRPSKGSYSYQATYGSGSSAITLYGTVDTVVNSSPNIYLNFKIFSEQAVKHAMCRSEGVSDQLCEYTNAAVSITFLDDHSWVVAKITLPELGPSVVVMDLSGGAWQKVVGPFSIQDINQLTGELPSFVMQVISP